MDSLDKYTETIEMSPDFIERRKSKLSPDEIEAIAVAVAHYQHHSCRFSSIDVKEMEEVVRRYNDISPDDILAALRFYKHVDRIMEDTGSITRKIIITGIVGGGFVLLCLGAYAKIKEIFSL